MEEEQRIQKIGKQMWITEVQQGRKITRQNLLLEKLDRQTSPVQGLLGFALGTHARHKNTPDAVARDHKCWNDDWPEDVSH